MYDKRRMADKAARQAALTRIVKKGRTHTQAELIAALGQAGFEVDQSTLSRDLQELGIRKAGGRYAPVEAPEGPDPHVDYAAAVTRFTTCGPHLIVIWTGVAQAPAVAAAIEEAKDPSILATLAGDDTIFVATQSRRAQTVALRRLVQWFGEKAE